MGIFFSIAQPVLGPGVAAEREPGCFPPPDLKRLTKVSVVLDGCETTSDSGEGEETLSQWVLPFSPDPCTTPHFIFGQCTAARPRIAP